MIDAPFSARPRTASHLPFLLRTALIAVLLALTAIAYHGAPDNAFHLDDANNIVRHGPIHATALDVDSLLRAAREGLLPQRVIPNMSFAIDWWRGGGNPAPFLVTNVLIHAATAIAVLALLLQILYRCGATARQAWPIATLTAAIWAVHPIQVQAVSYIVQRMTSLAALFMLIAVVTYIRGRQNGVRAWFAATLAATIAACLSKETAYALPALILLAEYTLCRTPDQRIRNHADRLILAFPLLAIAYVAFDLAILHGPVWNFVSPGYAVRDFSLGERLLTQPRVIVFHLGQILLPLPDRFSIEHDFPLSHSLWSPATTPLALAALLAWTAGGAWLALRSRFPAAGFCALWFPATLLVESSVISLEMVFEHRMYLPSAGLAGLLALGLLQRWRAGHSKAVMAVTALTLAGLSAATIQRVAEWKTPTALYQHAVRVAPGLPRAWTNLATAYETDDRTPDAIAAYTRALELDPGRALPYLNRGSSYSKIGNLAAAEADYRRFIALEPTDFRGPYALGALFSMNGRYQDAATWLQRATVLDPKAALPHFELANVYLAGGQPQAAITALAAARARDPAIADDNYFEQLGIAHGRLGQFDNAIQAFSMALQRAPSRTQTRINRGFAYLRSRRSGPALADFDAAIAQAPADARAHYGRAEALEQQGRHAEALAAVSRTLAIDPGHERAGLLHNALQAVQGAR